MNVDPIDSIVKGTPTAESAAAAAIVGTASGLGTTTGRGHSTFLASCPSQPNSSTSNAPATTTTTTTAGSKSTAAADPLSHTPSSPSMIYLNLLILEASLRAQYLELRARRRRHTFFLALLSLWLVGFGYALFLAPREDGRGIGGSVYWAIEAAERVCFLGGFITASLVWGTGIWDRGVRWPRRWFAISNRGLRGFNCKLVVIRRSWWAEALATIGPLLTLGLFPDTSSTSCYRYVESDILHAVDHELKLSRQSHPTLPTIAAAATDHDDDHDDDDNHTGLGGGCEEDLAPGGNHVKLLLLAKPFSPTFRENWEIYRTEYWERENDRRARIRARVKARDRELRRRYGGWFWWLPWRRRALLAMTTRPPPPPPPPSSQPTPSSQPLLQPCLHRHSPSAEAAKRTRSGSVRRGSMSGTEEQLSVGGRRGSTASSTSSEKRRKAKSAESRFVTPEIPSPLARETTNTLQEKPATTTAPKKTLTPPTARSSSTMSDTLSTQQLDHQPERPPWQ